GLIFLDNGDGTATLSGTPAAGTAGTYSLAITAANGTSPDASQNLLLTINDAPKFTSAAGTTFAPANPNSIFAPSNVPSFTVTTYGSAVSSLTASGTLPQGVTFKDNGDGTATLSGTPAAGSFGTYNLTLTAHNGLGGDATQDFALTVAAAHNSFVFNSNTRA